MAFAWVLLSVSARGGSPWTAAEFIPGESVVLLGSQRGLEFRNWPELTPAGTRFRTRLLHVHDLAFSPDGKRLLVAGGSPAESGTVEVWNLPERRLMHEVTVHTDVVYRVTWSPDGTSWFSAGGDGDCRMFATDSGHPLRSFHGHSAAVLSLICPDEQTLISVSVDQTVRLWNVADGRLLRTLDNHTGSVHDIAVRPKPPDPQQMLIATVSNDRTVRLWYPQIGRLLRFARLPSVPRTLVWSENGDQLLVGCDDGIVRVLSPDDMQIAAELPAQSGRIHELQLDPGRQHLLVAGESEVRIVRLNLP